MSWDPDQETQDEYVYPSFTHVLHGDDLDALRIFVEQHGGVDARYRPHSNTLLMEAVRGDLLDTARFLLSMGASADMLGFSGFPQNVPALVMAYSLAMTEVLLVEGRASVDVTTRSGATPLHYIVQRHPDDGLPERIQLLIDRGASLTACNNRGETPLDVFMRDRSPESVGASTYYAMVNILTPIPAKNAHG